MVKPWNVLCAAPRCGNEVKDRPAGTGGDRNCRVASSSACASRALWPLPEGAY